MKAKILSSFFFSLIFILVSCTPEAATELTVTQTLVSTQTPTTVPTQTSIPTLAFGRPYSTPVSYPTASIVKANSVAFIARDWQNYGPNSLWIVNLDGSGERRLVDVASNKSWIYDRMIKWSPDGKWISYFSKDDLWIVSIDGSKNKKLLSFPNLYTYAWSPDGSSIAYENIVSYKQTRTPTPDSDSWNTPVVIGIVDVATGKTSELSTHNANQPLPLSWSPDGRYILFAKDFSYTVFDVVAHKTAKEIKPSCWIDSNIWSPDSQWFFDVHHGNGRYTYNWICVSGLDGSSREIYIEGTVSVPVWDKTGKNLYFVARRTNPDGDPNLKIDERLMRYDVRTQNTERLLSLRDKQTWDFMQSVSLSPDGSSLLLQSQLSKTKFDFVFVDIGTLSTRKFTLDYVHLEVPFFYAYFLETAWSPDSQNIVLFAGDVETPNGIGIQYYGSFYTLNVKTGKMDIFSGSHSVEGWVISPIANVP